MGPVEAGWGRIIGIVYHKQPPVVQLRPVRNTLVWHDLAYPRRNSMKYHLIEAASNHSYPNSTKNRLSWAASRSRSARICFVVTAYLSQRFSTAAMNARWYWRK